MKKETINDLRNYAHYILAFPFLYRAGNATDFYEFDLWMQIVGSLFIGATFGGAFGAGWEKLNQILFNIVPDMTDIIRVAIGGVLGMLTSCFFKDVPFITFWMFYGCIALIVVDLIRATIKKIKG